MPFSDPLADGLTNQLAAQRALENGCKQDDVFRLVQEIRKFLKSNRFTPTIIWFFLKESGNMLSMLRKLG